MRHASFFSGVGGLDLGFERAGIATVSVSEIDQFASRVLRKNFPHVPNLGDIITLNADSIPQADIWSGGFPCQDLSAAGKRLGFDGVRSSLAFSFLNLVEKRLPQWLILENVPGLLKSNGGRDFERLITEIDQLGYGVAWRTLDARHYGVAQRRRRVFVVASLNDYRRAAAVLFNREGWGGDSSKSEAAQDHAATSPGSSANSIDRERITSQHDASQADTGGMRISNELAVGVDASRLISFPSAFSRQPTKFNAVADTLTISAGPPAVLYDAAPLIVEQTTERRRINSHRYKACGNGVVSNVAEWIGIGIRRANENI